MQIKKAIMCLILFAVMSYSFAFAQTNSTESLTITTYYPSPTGVYATLRLVPGAAPGTCDASVEGKMYYNQTVGSVNICVNTAGVWNYQPIGSGGLWTLNGSNVTAANTTWNVGIGTSTPSSTLHVAGNITVTNNVTAGAFLYSSDRALKTNIRPAQNSLEKVLSLAGMTFNWKKDGRQDMGLIAQDVERVYPELVSTNSATGLKSVEYGNLIAPLIEAIKAQQQQIETLNNKIEQLEARKR